MANTKGKIIIGAGIAVTGSIITFLIIRAIRKKNVAERIYKKLDDVTTQSGLSATLDEEDKHKANYGFQPMFWKEGKDGVMPDKDLLLPPKIARERAKEIYKAIHDNDWFGASEDEDKVLSVIKKSKSQGQLSQVAHQYSSGVLNYGSLADDVKTALKSTWYGSENRLKELNNFINSLPY